ncbi:pilus assembly protein PilE [Cupriavidus sp. USMAA2-4]|uniref:type IV pilin protein n=1 Tax=Cupriavidus sp. USMAA2-4 TaxID=876364 RepID=UPI0008A6B9CC|nr:type IV pilin protein [Cupriavidus sp. USMAA2-4]AOY93170.1 pilus assembly protein PilE [Cupriavidus sp. USMAA2-4]
MRGHPVRPAARPRHAAFTVLELLFALAIVAVLAAIAMPAWQQHIERGRRQEAKAALVAAMLELERHALATASYAAPDAPATVAGQWPRAVPPPPAAARHMLLAAACPQAGIDRCVELHAVPMQADPRCGTLILRSTGEWLVQDGAAGPPQPLPGDC